MRFICAFLIGLIALSSVGAAQSLPGGPDRIPKGGFSKPQGRGIVPKGPDSIPQGGWGKSRGIVPQGPTIIVPIPPPCPRGNCKAIAEPQGKSCPEGQVRKRRKCVETTNEGPEDVTLPAAKFRDKSCPEGQVRKRRKCVEITHGAPEEVTPPTPPAPKEPAPKVKQADPIPPAAPPLPTRKQADPIPPTIAALTADRPHRPLEILVLVDSARADEIVARLAQQFDLTFDLPVPLVLLDGALVRFSFESGRSLESLLAALSADPDVDLVQPNYDYLASKDQTPPQNAPQYAGKTIRLEEAHLLARGQGVMIAVIDTAIETDHPELTGAIAGVFDAVGEGPSKPELHGTEIAGILRARAKLTGVAPEAKLLSVRAFRGEGKAGPAQSTSLRLLKGIDWAFDTGAKVMNMSFTGPLDPLLERIVAAAAEEGVIFVAAAGNDGPMAPPVYPAAYPQVIAVTATDDKDQLYGKANRGDYISLAAPGVDIIAPALKGTYELSSGTSMAAAHVSGVVALLLERHAELSAAEISAILASSARKPPEPFGEDAIGAGILDAAGAVGHDGIETSPEAGASTGP